MAGRERKPYRYVGTERELADHERYERALRAWTGYLLQHLVEERVEQRRNRQTDRQP